jgi:glutamine amidotransferase
MSAELEVFAFISRNSKEYQGHGWGCAYIDETGNWQYYKNIRPIWEDRLGQFGKTTFLLAHARSAFQDKDIAVENNMPFHNDRWIFMFNGELHGVRLKEEGKTGARKIFNLIDRSDGRDTKTALKKTIRLIKKRTRHVRALNIIITDKEKLYINNSFLEDPDYFQMYYKKMPGTISICSDPYPKETNWQKMKTDKIEVF